MLELLPLEVWSIMFRYCEITDLRRFMFLCKKLHHVVREELYTKIYSSRIEFRLGLKDLIRIYHQNPLLWSRLCLNALACVHQSEWNPGVLRLFYAKDNVDLSTFSQMQRFYPDPRHQAWAKVIECTMDYEEFVQDHAHTLSPSQKNIETLYRYSERMDIGTYLLYITLPTTSYLLRCKPIGSANNKDRLVIWDDSRFGFCVECKRKLVRIQVCADCRVVQYCSRDCQRKDWEAGHRVICKTLAFEFDFGQYGGSDHSD